MNRSTTLALFLFAAATSACSDTVSPNAQSAEFQVAADKGKGGHGKQPKGLSATDTFRLSFVIDPSTLTVVGLGQGNEVVFPAGSVCDPSSTYGTTQWDQPCAVAQSAIHENVTAWLNADGHPQVDFSPNLRFVPSAVSTNWVTLTFADVQASLDPMFNILYCSDPTAPCVDESLTDPTLVTVRDPVTGVISRRIKHFSGYLVGAGDDMSGMSLMNRSGAGVKMSPSVAPLPSAGTAAPAAMKGAKSGYILVSG